MATDDSGPWEGLTIAGGRYERLTTIGVGGMGYVYRAVDRNLKTDVVIKAPRSSLVVGPELAERFEQEVGALVRLSFPHIVPIIDIGRHAGTSFAVMRYLPQGNLVTRAITQENGRAAPMPWQSMRYWLPSIAKALDFVHRSQFVHRDVKPRNILFDEHGQAYLSDFGIIKGIGLTATGESRYRTADGINVGTVDYMAPEILKNQPFDGRADQYSLALTVYEYLAGRLPFANDSVAEVINAHLTAVPTPLSEIVRDVPAAISAAVAKALSKNPSERFRDCGDFARAMLGSSMTSVDVPAESRRTGRARTPTDDYAAPGETLIARPQARSASRKFLSSRWGAVVAAVAFTIVAATVLAVALEWRAQSEASVPLEQNALGRMIAEWKRRVSEVERSRTVDSQQILAALEYDDAAELQQLLTAQAAADRRDYLGKLDDLEGELTFIASLHQDRTTELRKLSAAPAISSSDETPSAEAISAQRRELQDQASELTTMAHRLRSLMEKSQSLDAYDAAALTELTHLNEMEAVLGSGERREASANCLARANELAVSRNPSLAWIAVQYLARSANSAAVKTVVARFHSYPPERQRSLLLALLLSGGDESISAGLRQARAKPEILEVGAREELLKIAERDAGKYHELIDLLLENCDSSDERLRIFLAQTQALSDRWLKELEVACTQGLLVDHVDAVLDEIILRKRTAAYPLAQRLFAISSNSAFADYAGTELDELLKDAPKLAEMVAQTWIVRGSASLRAAAVAEYCRSGTPLSAKTLAAELKTARVRDPESLVNLLIKQDSNAAAQLSADAIESLPDLDLAKIAYASASSATLHWPAARDALLDVAWDNGAPGRAWALTQILGAGFLKQFEAAEADRDDQMSIMREIVQILSGKLVALPNTPATGPRDRGLSVGVGELLELPQRIDIKRFAPDGSIQARLAALRSDLSMVATSTSPRFSDVIAAMDRYLAKLESLNRNAFETATIYDFTVQQQLPGVKRTMQVNPTPTWDFRFAASHIVRFERERTTFQSLSETLPKARAAIPLP